MSTSQCPCGSEALYDDCCGRFHSGARFATTAEELMRSRYSAFVLRNAPYLLATWHPSTRPKNVRMDDNRAWTGLRIERSERGGPLDEHGIVEFTAHFQTHGIAEETHEVSTFTRVDGKWAYVDEVD